MKNVIISIFSDESKTYEALSNLKNKSGNTFIRAAGIIKNENGIVTVKDGFNSDDVGTNWAFGGLIGSLIGILAGPLGVLLGGSLGAIIGAGVDVGSSDDAETVVSKVLSKLKNYNLALVVIADETNENELDDFLLHYSATDILRESYAAVESEIEEMKQIEKDLAKEAKRKVREQKKKSKE